MITNILSISLPKKPAQKTPQFPLTKKSYSRRKEIKPKTENNKINKILKNIEETHHSKEHAEKSTNFKNSKIIQDDSKNSVPVSRFVNNEHLVEQLVKYRVNVDVSEDFVIVAMRYLLENQFYAEGIDVFLRFYESGDIERIPRYNAVLLVNAVGVLRKRGSGDAHLLFRDFQKKEEEESGFVDSEEFRKYNGKRIHEVTQEIELSDDDLKSVVMAFSPVLMYMQNLDKDIANEVVNHMLDIEQIDRAMILFSVMTIKYGTKFFTNETIQMFHQKLPNMKLREITSTADKFLRKVKEYESRNSQWFELNEQNEFIEETLKTKEVIFDRAKLPNLKGKFPDVLDQLGTPPNVNFNIQFRKKTKGALVDKDYNLSQTLFAINFIGALFILMIL